MKRSTANRRSSSSIVREPRCQLSMPMPSPATATPVMRARIVRLTMTSINVNPPPLWPELLKLPPQIIIGGVCHLSRLRSVELNRSLARAGGPDHRDRDVQPGLGCTDLHR